MVEGYANHTGDRIFADARDQEEWRSPRVTVKVEKNSRGYTWSASYRGDTVEETMAQLDRLVTEMRTRYGGVDR